MLNKPQVVLLMIYGLNNIYLKKHKHLEKKRKTTPQNKQNQTNNNNKKT